MFYKIIVSSAISSTARYLKLYDSSRKLNKTSIQWTSDVKFISATTKKFWSKIIFEQQNQKNFPDKNFFSEKIWKKQNLGKKKLKKKFWIFFFNFKYLYLTHILSTFQVVQTTAPLCHNVVSHKKVKKTIKSQKRSLATTVQPKPNFSGACGFPEVLGINEECLEAKFHQNQ